MASQQEKINSSDIMKQFTDLLVSKLSEIEKDGNVYDNVNEDVSEDEINLAEDTFKTTIGSLAGLIMKTQLNSIESKLCADKFQYLGVKPILGPPLDIPSMGTTDSVELLTSPTLVASPVSEASTVSPSVFNQKPQPPVFSDTSDGEMSPVPVNKMSFDSDDDSLSEDEDDSSVQISPKKTVSKKISKTVSKKTVNLYTYDKISTEGLYEETSYYARLDNTDKEALIRCTMCQVFFKPELVYSTDDSLMCWHCLFWMNYNQTVDYSDNSAMGVSVNDYLRKCLEAHQPSRCPRQSNSCYLCDNMNMKGRLDEMLPGEDEEYDSDESIDSECIDFEVAI